jgi:hypothetical protein
MTTKYQQFVKDNQKRIKEEFPELSNTERFAKLADEWKKHKATLEEPARTANSTNAANAANAANSANSTNAANAANSKYATEFYIARLVLTHAMLHI